MGFFPAIRKTFDLPLVAGTRLLNPSTPLTDQMLATQSWEDGVVDVFYALMGRMRFRLGSLDNWGVMPYLGRVTASGKSTIVGLVQKTMFADETCGGIFAGVMRSSKSDLGTMYQYDAIFESDSREKLSLSYDIFKSMVTGNQNIEMKIYNTCFSAKFDRPMMICSSHVLKLPGLSSKNHDAIKHRVVAFPFTKCLGGIHARNIELGAFTARCLTSYFSLLSRAGGQGSSLECFWNAVPEQLRQLRDARYAFICQ